MRRPLLAFALLSLTACATLPVPSHRFGCVITNRDKAVEVGGKVKAVAARPADASPAQAAVVVGLNAAAIAAGHPSSSGATVVVLQPEIRAEEPHAKP